MSMCLICLFTREPLLFSLLHSLVDRTLHSQCESVIVRIVKIIKRSCDIQRVSVYVSVCARIDV